jgi:uracil-DNA glycosylase family 4
MFSNIIQPDALSTPTEIVARAKELGRPSICLTDHGSVSGIPELVKACKDAGLKPIIGSELYVCHDPAKRPEKGAETRRDYAHTVALAMNWDGWVELLELLTKANDATHFYYKPRNSFAELAQTKNLIFLTACGGGILSLEDHECVLQTLKDAVGADRIYCEIQPHDDERQHMINKRAVIAAAKLGLKLVATQDFHYARPGDHLNHEVLLAIGSKDVWSNPNRWKYPVDDLYLKSTAEMIEAFIPHVKAGTLAIEDVKNAIAQTEEIADRLNVEWKSLPVSLPDMGDDPNGQLARLCIEEMKAKALPLGGEYGQRLLYELEVMKKAGFPGYFLVLRDIIHWARKNGIMVGPGRGSAGGSLICYLLGITQVDPLVHGLIFERFFRPGRVDLPDIDTDFEDEGRDRVLAYVRERFGEEYVANVANYNTLGVKSAIKDVARVFEIDSFVVNQATSVVDDLKLSTEQVFEQPTITGLMTRYPAIRQYAPKLTGVLRGTSQHAGGIVIAGEPLRRRAVVSRRGEGEDERTVINWDKNVIEKMGLMKLDLLGLRTLSILRVAAENVFRSRGVKIDYTSIPLDDAKTLDMFQRGDTTGIFQFESRGMRELLKSLRIDKFNVIVDANALYRPGPMELIPVYTSAQTGKMAVFYDHPLLEPILSETFGVLIYQEQLMRVFVDLAGFSYSDADGMRKIVSKSMGPEEFAKHEGKFMDGATAKGIDPAIAKQVFKQMITFGGYGFNKSHAVQYSIIGFWCAFMKTHYPAEFMAAHLSNSDEEQTALAVDAAKKMGLEILMPDVNQSHARRFVPFNDRVIMAPLSAIKGVGEKAADLIVQAREGQVDYNGLGIFDTRTTKSGTVSHDATKVKKGPFESEKDFMDRVYKRVVNTKVQGLLYQNGAFPWHKPADEALFLARRANLGHIFRESMKVSYSEFLDLDPGTVSALHNQVYSEIHKLAAKAHMKAVLPGSGAKPRMMLVFEKPEWNEEKHGVMSHGKSYEMFRSHVHKVLGLDGGNFYVSSLLRFRDPPLGVDPFLAESQAILAAEIDLLKPPLIIAFGKRPIEFFTDGKGRVGEHHCKIVMRGKTPVLCSMSPMQAIMEPSKTADFLKIVDALGEIYK